jgi:transposase
LKLLVLAQCAEPGASVAKVAMAHGLNANLVHKWRRQANAGQEDAPAMFVPVTVAAEPAVSDPPQFVDVQLQRGSVHVRVR